VFDSMDVFLHRLKNQCRLICSIVFDYAILHQLPIDREDFNPWNHYKIRGGKSPVADELVKQTSQRQQKNFIETLKKDNV